MPHDDLSADDVLDLIEAHLPTATQARKKSDVQIGFVLYDAIAVRGSYDDYGNGSWGFGVLLGGDASVSKVLGQKLSIRSTRDEVRAALEAIDRYARLRLGPEFLAAYAAANGG
jgi:hypothetical protein